MFNKFKILLVFFFYLPRYFKTYPRGITLKCQEGIFNLVTSPLKLPSNAEFRINVQNSLSISLVWHFQCLTVTFGQWDFNRWPITWLLISLNILNNIILSFYRKQRKRRGQPFNFILCLGLIMASLTTRPPSCLYAEEFAIIMTSTNRWLFTAGMLIVFW